MDNPNQRALRRGIIPTLVGARESAPTQIGARGRVLTRLVLEEENMVILGWIRSYKHWKPWEI